MRTSSAIPHFLQKRCNPFIVNRLCGVCIQNVHPDYTTVRSASQAKSLENKGPTGFNPWGAYVFSMEARGVEPLS